MAIEIYEKMMAKGFARGGSSGFELGITRAYIRGYARGFVHGFASGIISAARKYGAPESSIVRDLVDALHISRAEAEQMLRGDKRDTDILGE